MGTDGELSVHAYLYQMIELADIKKARKKKEKLNWGKNTLYYRGNNGPFGNSFLGTPPTACFLGIVALASCAQPLQIEGHSQISPHILEERQIPVTHKRLNTPCPVDGCTLSFHRFEGCSTFTAIIHANDNHGGGLEKVKGILRLWAQEEEIYVRDN